MVKIYVNRQTARAESVQFSQLMFDQYNVCEYNDSNVMMVGSKPRFPKKSCALYAGN